LRPSADVKIHVKGGVQVQVQVQVKVKVNVNVNVKVNVPLGVGSRLMALTAERLVRLLEEAKDVDEWIAVETRIRHIARTTGDRRERSSGETVTLSAVVFRDSERGRGGARLWLDGAAGDDDRARRLIARMAERASLAIGPAWTLPAPAAPARVRVSDSDIAGDEAAVVDTALAQLAKLNGRAASIPRARIEAETRWHRADTSRGFASHYQATSTAFDVAVESHGARERIRGRVRSASQLALARRVADAARTGARRAAAKPLEPGRYDLLLRPAAITGPCAWLESAEPAGYGWFAPLVAHVSAEWVRLGISAYQPGHAVFDRGREPRLAAAEAVRRDDRSHRADPFTLSSDGTIDLAPLSAPFGDLGEPVRRFEIVREGRAAGLALDHREAALARSAPNGGVRNLALAPGRTPARGLLDADQRPLLDVAELAWIDADPRSGAVSAAIRLATLRGGAVAGGLVVGNAFDLLGRARLSVETGTRGWYRGPIAIRIDGVDIA
jgi:PmbA/TldA metallopeptidase C-terminal domain